MPFEDKAFYFTSTTGSSAAVFRGMIIHDAAHLNKQRITGKWKQVRILIIGKRSFFKMSDMVELDKKLRRLTGRDREYGGISIVFLGDFHQIPPVKTSNVLYFCSAELNCLIFLENSHRFKDDDEWKKIMH